jgi:hypothetical protein
MAKVGPDGQIIMPTVEAAVEPPPMKMDGSAIDSSAKIVQQSVNTQVEANQALGGKVGGRRSRRSVRMSRGQKRYKGGAEVEVKNVPPNMVTAGNSDPKGVFAGLLELQARATADSAYDGLGNAPPRTVGGKRSKKKHNGSARRVRHHTRKHRGARRKHRSVHHSRRRIRSHK